MKQLILPYNLNQSETKLAPETNLPQWGKSASDLCKLCLQAGAQLQGRRQATTNYIFEWLQGCTTPKKIYLEAQQSY